MPHDFSAILEQSSIGEGNRWLSFGRALKAIRHGIGMNAETALRLSGLTESRFWNVEFHAPEFGAAPTDDEIRAYCRALDLEPNPIVAHAASLRGERR